MSSRFRPKAGGRLFNKFREKLAGFKESLGSKLQEKIDKQGQTKETAELEELDIALPEGETAESFSMQSMKVSSEKYLSSGKGPKDPNNNFKPESTFSLLDKAKSLVFDQEVILEEKDLEEPLWQLEMALLESDVALPVAEEIVSFVKSDLVGSKKKIGANTADLAEMCLKNALIDLLSKNYLDFDNYIRGASKPIRILFVGVNGTGKTTSIAKVARYLQDRSYSVVLAAGDTFRAGAIEQLEVHGKKLGLKVIKHKTGSDPAAVIFDAIEYAKAHNKDIVLADTAGRLHTNVNLMDQMKKIVRVTKPDLLIFVDEAIAGNDAIERARLFNESVPIGGSILTKTDADAKGGSAISISYITGKPIIFLGVGQAYSDLVKFEPQWLVDRLLGDVASA
ncbi:MAG: signal recognition particle-docking protein FtsY [Methanotrichaceae archaeon]|nr:signal recognition particle-docking protein FtsY [Methanotrichaceae archaeon]